MDVEKNALDLGYDKKIEFGDGTVRFYKIIRGMSLDDREISRKCAQEHGILPTVFNKDMIKKLSEAVNTDYFFVGNYFYLYGSTFHHTGTNGMVFGKTRVETTCADIFEGKSLGIFFYLSSV